MLAGKFIFGSIQIYKFPFFSLQNTNLYRVLCVGFGVYNIIYTRSFCTRDKLLLCEEGSAFLLS